MISWLQTSFQRHMKLVVFLLIAVMGIPLVFIYSTSGGFGTADQGLKERHVFGKRYTTEQDVREFRLDGQISVQLASGNPFLSPEPIEMYSFFRAAKLAVADELRIPGPTPDQITAFIRTLPAFSGEDGEYDPLAYSRFLDSTRNNPIYSQARVARVIAEDWRGEQATRAIAGPGFVIDPEVRVQLAAADTSWSVVRATLPLTDIQAEGEPSEMEITQWFENNAARYRFPPQVQVSMVDFPVERYSARQTAEPGDDEIVRFFESRKFNYATPPAPAAEGETPPPPTEPRLEDVRDRVIADIKQQRAVTAASKAAADFAYELFDKKITRGTAAFDQLLAQYGAVIQPMPPISVTPEAAQNPIAREALSLSPDKPVSDPVVAGPAALVLFYDGRVDATDALLSQVRERVIADVQRDRRTRAIVARGEAVRAQLVAAVQAGTPFAEAARAAGLEPKAWENFTRRQLPEDFDRSLIVRMNDLPAGEISPMTVQGDTGTFLYVASRREPVVSSDDPNYGDARRAMMNDAAMTVLQSKLTAMVRAERLAAGIDRPEDADRF